MKFSNAFKPTQPTENATEVTTWHWASNCRPPNDFADMLENIFSGHPNNPSPPPQLAEADSNLQKVLITIKGMKANEASEECGLVAGLLHYAPENVWCTILNIMSTTRKDGEIKCAWRKTLFQMLPPQKKTKQSKVTTDFRPIANIRLMYKMFAYLFLGRFEGPLEQWQPEEQHGFRNRRIEKHFLTANMVVDNKLLRNTPLWRLLAAWIGHHCGKLRATWCLPSFGLVVTDDICEPKRPSCDQQ